MSVDILNCIQLNVRMFLLNFIVLVLLTLIITLFSLRNDSSLVVKSLVKHIFRYGFEFISLNHRPIRPIRAILSFRAYNLTFIFRLFFNYLKISSRCKVIFREAKDGQQCFKYASCILKVCERYT